MNVQNNQRGLRRLIAFDLYRPWPFLVFDADVPGAIADDTDRPTVWIELGADLQAPTDIGQQTFAPAAFVANNPGFDGVLTLSRLRKRSVPQLSVLGRKAR